MRIFLYFPLGACCNLYQFRSVNKIQNWRFFYLQYCIRESEKSSAQILLYPDPGPKIPTGACQPIFNVAGSSEQKRVFCNKFYMVNLFDGLPFKIKTTNKAGAVLTIGCHFTEKELKKEKSGYFLSWSLRGCSEPASQARGLAWILEPGLLCNMTVKFLGADQ